MTNIDLVDYANSSQKIPQEVLHASLEAENVHAWRIGLAHYLDFCLITAVTLGTSKVFALSVKDFLPTLSLKAAYASMHSTYIIALIPFVLFSYYFFSYFLNNGQSWGHHVSKIRISLKERSFRSAFHHAAYSAVYCLTGGLSFYWSPLQKSTTNHDHLYRQLMIIKDQTAVNILTLATHEEPKTESAEYTELAA